MDSSILNKTKSDFWPSTIYSFHCFGNIVQESRLKVSYSPCWNIFVCLNIFICLISLRVFVTRREKFFKESMPLHWFWSDKELSWYKVNRRHGTKPQSVIFLFWEPLWWGYCVKMARILWRLADRINWSSEWIGFHRVATVWFSFLWLFSVASA